nr:odorant receptor 37 [Graphosoma rubrolineatum]
MNTKKHIKESFNKIGFVEETSQLFLHGLRRYKSKSPISIPISLAVAVGNVMVCSMITGAILNYTKTDWVQLFINLILIPVSVIVGTMILRYQKSFSKVSKEIDCWWNYTFLEEKTDEMKKNAVEWMAWFGRYYYIGMYFSLSMNLVPFIKCHIWGKSKDPMNNLMYPCWTPLDLGTWWGFGMTYMFQFTSMYLSYFTFGNTCFYLTTAYVSIGYQAQLIGMALLSVEQRCEKLSEAYKDISKRKIMYETYVKQEIVSCIKHYQQLQRSAKELSKIYSTMAILAYNIGIIVLSISGIRLTTENDKLMLVNSFMNAFVTLGNQFIISFICELLTEEVEKLRNIIYYSSWVSMPVSCQKYIYTFLMMVDYMPTPTTLTGMKTNYENFSKVVNTSYCYFSLMLSMRIK